MRKDASLGPIRRETIKPVVTFLRESGLYSDFTWHKTAKRFGRHSVAHGNHLEYMTHANAVRAMLALDSLYWLIGFPYREKSDQAATTQEKQSPSGEVWTANAPRTPRTAGSVRRLGKT
jgi:hypothetical protein